ncbi:MAG TPA: signal peptidase I [Allosphingosinicella sp.]|uniref:signal peptidase I n=1 Tax=Allosphingosinicella sp. TaxID=2823234 RepID=UPI002ED975A1
MDAETSGAAAPPQEKKSEGLKETTRFLLFLFLGALILRSFIIAPFSIPSGSMLPRMMIGDYLFVAKWPYGYSRYSFPFGLGGFDGRIFENMPERGDVAVFRYPGNMDEDYVKRVVGLPGDLVEVRNGAVFINGEEVQRTRVADFLMPISENSPCRVVDPNIRRIVQGDEGEQLCAYPRFRETLPSRRSYYVLDQTTGPGDTFPPTIVPEGHYFVMGDNRDDSFDSRFPVAVGGVSLLPAENLVGRALITFFSTDGSADYLKPWTWFSAARWNRIGKTY